MGTEEPRWFYVGNGQLRLKDGEDWTDEYQTIESRRAHVPQAAAVVEPDSQHPLPGARPRGRPMLWLMICAAVVVAGGTGTAFAKDALKNGGLLSASSAYPAADVVAPANSAPAKGAPAKAVPAKAAHKTSASWAGGYEKADYAKRVGDIPPRVAAVRTDSEYQLATRVDLMSLGLQFDDVGRLPAPPKVDPQWWATNTKALSKLSLKAADEWASGNQKAAMVRFEAVVKRSNTLVTKVNAACGLHIRLSKTSA
jgi:hypothetical protein